MRSIGGKQMALSKVRGNGQNKRSITYVLVMLQLPLSNSPLLCLFQFSKLATTIAIKKLSRRCHLILFQCYLISAPKTISFDHQAVCLLNGINWAIKPFPLSLSHMSTCTTVTPHTASYVLLRIKD